MGTKRTKKAHGEGTVGRKGARTLRQIEPALRPLTELFAVVDDVMTEHDAFDPNQIHKSLGRIYRAWLDSRDQLDPDFDRERYRHDMKAHQASKPRLSPLGRSLPASGTTKRSSSEAPSTSEKKRKTSAKNERPRRRQSVPDAQSESNASGKRSRPMKSTASGAGSQGESGSASRSGSSKKASARSPKRKD